MEVSVSSALELHIAKMEKQDLAREVIPAFRHYFSLLESGETGKIHEQAIAPLSHNEIPALEQIAGRPTDTSNPVKKTVMIKLNGGLGTSMGLSGPKFRIPVRENKNFLDITLEQLRVIKERTGATIPLVLMDSFNTRDSTVAYIEEQSRSVPIHTFLQHRFPKVLKESLEPAEWTGDRKYEWNPPGHGDIYGALYSSGLLRKLIDEGYRYAMVSNVDNLGATLDVRLLSYFADSGSPFLMEVVRRTAMHKKGGHLARRNSDDRLILREIAQCPESDLDSFQDIRKYWCFNSNNIWLDLEAVYSALEQNDGFLALPMICNEKYLVPKNTDTPRVYQIETAMGAAISSFAESKAIQVPVGRFLPVKRSPDLLVVQSDRYHLNDDYDLVENPECAGSDIRIDLDEDYYGTYGDLVKRFPYGAPSLAECGSLTVHGDVLFGRNVKLLGDVAIRNQKGGQVCIPDGKAISGEVSFT